MLHNVIFLNHFSDIAHYGKTQRQSEYWTSLTNNIKSVIVSSRMFLQGGCMRFKRTRPRKGSVSNMTLSVPRVRHDGYRDIPRGPHHREEGCDTGPKEKPQPPTDETGTKK